MQKETILFRIGILQSAYSTNATPEKLTEAINAGEDLPELTEASVDKYIPLYDEIQVDALDKPVDTIEHNQDAELVKHLRDFAPAYEYLNDKHPEMLRAKVVGGMKASDLCETAKDAGLFCEDGTNDAIEKLVEDGHVWGVTDVSAEAKAGNMYAEECKALICAVAEREGWDKIWYLLRHLDHMTVDQPALFTQPATIL